MAGYIQVPADGVGKRVDTVTLTDELAEVHRQKMVVTGGSGTAEVVVVTDAAPSGTDMGLVVRQAGTLTAVVSGTVNVNGGVAISGTATVAGNVNISTMPAVTLAADQTLGNISRTVQVAIGTPFTLQGISTTVQVAVATPFTIQAISTTVTVAGVVGLTAGAANIGFINHISRTVTIAGVVSFAAGAIVDSISKTVVTAAVLYTTGGTAVEDATNNAIRVNVVAGSGSGFSMVDGTSFTAQEANFVPVGGIFDDATPGALTENEAGVVRLTSARAMHVNLRLSDGSEIGGTSATGVFVRTATVALAADQILGSISRTVQVAIGTPFILQGISTTVIIAMSNQTLQGISTTVTVAGTVSIGNNLNISNTPSVILAAGTANFGVLDSISKTVQVAVGTPFIIQGISTTVTTVVTGYTPAIMSGSHGPKCVTASTSANVTLIASPGAGANIYVTQLMVGNFSGTLSRARVGTSASISTIVYPMAASGGGFVLHFDPPWMLSASEACVCSVKPNVADAFFTVNFFVR